MDKEYRIKKADDRPADDDDVIAHKHHVNDDSQADLDPERHKRNEDEPDVVAHYRPKK